MNVLNIFLKITVVGTFTSWFRRSKGRRTDYLKPNKDDVSGSPFIMIFEDSSIK